MSENIIKNSYTEMLEFKVGLEEIHRDIYLNSTQVIAAIKEIQGREGIQSEALNNFMNFFEIVEGDLLMPSLIYSSRLYKLSAEIYTDLASADNFK